jgi:hypothetical protein
VAIKVAGIAAGIVAAEDEPRSTVSGNLLTARGAPPPGPQHEPPPLLAAEPATYLYIHLQLLLYQRQPESLFIQLFL